MNHGLSVFELQSEYNVDSPLTTIKINNYKNNTTGDIKLYFISGSHADIKKKYSDRTINERTAVVVFGMNGEYDTNQQYMNYINAVTKTNIIKNDWDNMFINRDSQPVRVTSVKFDNMNHWTQGRVNIPLELQPDQIIMTKIQENNQQFSSFIIYAPINIDKQKIKQFYQNILYMADIKNIKTVIIPLIGLCGKLEQQNDENSLKNLHDTIISAFTDTKLHLAKEIRFVFFVETQYDFVKNILDNDFSCIYNNFDVSNPSVVSGSNDKLYITSDSYIINTLSNNPKYALIFNVHDHMFYNNYDTYKQIDKELNIMNIYENIPLDIKNNIRNKPHIVKIENYVFSHIIYIYADYNTRIDKNVRKNEYFNSKYILCLNDEKIHNFAVFPFNPYIIKNGNELSLEYSRINVNIDALNYIIKNNTNYIPKNIILLIPKKVYEEPEFKNKISDNLSSINYNYFSDLFKKPLPEKYVSIFINILNTKINSNLYKHIRTKIEELNSKFKEYNKKRRSEKNNNTEYENLQAKKKYQETILENAENKIEQIHSYYDKTRYKLTRLFRNSIPKFKNETNFDIMYADINTMILNGSIKNNDHIAAHIRFYNDVINNYMSDINKIIDEKNDAKYQLEDLNMLIDRLDTDNKKYFKLKIPTNIRQQYDKFTYYVQLYNILTDDQKIELPKNTNIENSPGNLIEIEVNEYKPSMNLPGNYTIVNGGMIDGGGVLISRLRELTNKLFNLNNEIYELDN